MLKIFALLCLLFFSLSREHLFALNFEELFAPDLNGIYKIEFIVSNYDLSEFNALLHSSQLKDIIKRARELKLFHVAQTLEECKKIQIKIPVR